LLGLGLLLATITIKRINPKRFPTRIARTLEGLKEALGAMSRKKTEATLALLITTSIQGLFIFLNVLIADKIGIHVPVAVWLIAFPLAKMVAFLPLSLGGLGVREGVVAAVLLPFSVPTALAIAQSLVWQTVTFAVGILGGMIALWIGYRKPRPQVA
jgi:glycosyltransferase 2 family protein